MNSLAAGSAFQAGEPKSKLFPPQASDRWGNCNAKSPVIRRAFSPVSGSLNNKALRRFTPLRSPRSERIPKSRTKSASTIMDVTTSDFLNFFPRPIVRGVPTSQLLPDIVEQLAKWGQFITAVQDDTGKVTGLIDVMDLMSVCYNFIHAASDIETASYECRETYYGQSAQDFLGTHGSPTSYTSLSGSLADVFELLSQPNVKRVVVLRDGCTQADSLEDIVFIITPTEVLKYLAEHPQLYAALELTAMDCMPAPPPLSQKSCESLRFLSSEALNKYITSCAFKAVWNKQLRGGVTMHGTSLMDKFINWIAHIVAAQPEVDTEGVELKAEATLRDVIKMFLEQSTDTAIISEGSFVMGQIQARDVFGKILSGSETLPRGL